MVSFDWPSADSTVNYLKDGLDASEMSIRLVSYVIVKLAARQRAGCRINIHLLGHLTGAYVFRVAFYNARKKRTLHRSPCNVSQVAFVGSDIESATMFATDSVHSSNARRASRTT